jgi:hypothetical protein
LNTPAAKNLNAQVAIKDGEVLSLETEKLATELQALRRAFSAMNKGDPSPEGQLLIKQMIQAEKNLLATLDGLNAMLLKLHNAATRQKS